MKSKQYKKNLTLFKVSIPFLFSILLNSVSPIINTLIVSLVPNDGVIYAEAVGVSTQIYMLFSAIITFSTSGIGIIIGQLIGRKTPLEDLYPVIFTIVIVAFCFSLTIFSLSELLNPLILLAYLDSDSKQYADALLYSEVITISLIFSGTGAALLGVCNAYGYSSYSVVIAASSLVLDLVLTLSFVLLIKIGIVGSALGTLLANIYYVSFAFGLFSLKVTKLKFKWKYFRKEIVKKLAKVSLPITIERTNYIIAFSVLSMVVAQTGIKFNEDFLIGEGTNVLNLSRTMLLTFANLLYVVSLAFGTGTEIIASRHLGSENYEKTKKIVKQALIISLVIDGTLSIGYCFLSSYIIDFFALENLEIENNAALFESIFFVPSILVFFLQIGRTFNIIYFAAARASGDVKYNTIWSMIVNWMATLLGLWLVFIFGSNNKGDVLYGLNGYFIAIVLDEIIRGMINFFRWKSEKWMTYRIFENGNGDNLRLFEENKRK